MCGITGSVGTNSNKRVIDGLRSLQNRGYDSSGIMYLDPNTKLSSVIKQIKSAEITSPIDWLSQNISDIKSELSIGHTRWATHGIVSIDNTHPHISNKKSIHLVHNGIIENYLEIKKNLIDAGYNFYSDTDSEVIANYLEYIYEKDTSFDVINEKLHGSWAILFVHVENPLRIYFLKKGSPLVIGYSICKNTITATSEISGFDQSIERYIDLLDGEFGYFEQNKLHTKFKYVDEPINYESLSILPSNYEHWTLKEIFDQKCTINNFIDNFTSYHNALDKYQLILTDVEHIIFLACGTSYHAAKFSLSYFKNINKNLTYEVIDGAEFNKTDIPNRKCIFIILSQSGETKDLFHVIDIANELNILTIGLINVEKSTLAKKCNVTLYLTAGRENAVASTKVFLSQILLLKYVANYIRNTESIENTFYKNTNIVVNKFLCDDNKIAQIKNIAEKIKYSKSIFVLGRNNLEWISKEGALKIKEISYIHAEGYSTHALKHGPFALLTKETPVIVLLNNNDNKSKVLNSIIEISSRNAPIYLITNSDINSDIKNHINAILTIESTEDIFPYVSVIPLQLLSYMLSITNGLNPDFPRNLAKVVTVE